MSGIKLRDYRNRKEVYATQEVAAAYGHIDEDSPFLNPPGSSCRFGFDWASMELGETGDTVQDSHGDRIFLTTDGNEEVPERFLEPFCKGMSPRRFGKVTVVVEFVGTSALQDLEAAVDDRLAALADSSDDGPEPGVFTIIGGQKRRYINATEMALSMQTGDYDTHLADLDSQGKEFSKSPENAHNQDGPPGMEINPNRSHWDNIPGHPFQDWKLEVEGDETRLGYEEWARNRIDGAQADGQVFCLECGNNLAPDEACDSAHCVALREEEEAEEIEKQGKERCRSCGEIYNLYGDGFDGECPECADKTDTKDPWAGVAQEALAAADSDEQALMTPREALGIVLGLLDCSCLGKDCETAYRRLSALLEHGGTIDLKPPTDDKK